MTEGKKVLWKQQHKQWKYKRTMKVILKRQGLK